MQVSPKPKSAHRRPAAPHITPEIEYFDEHPPWEEQGQDGPWLRWKMDNDPDLAGWHVFRRPKDSCSYQWLGFTTNGAFALPAETTSVSYVYLVRPETKDGWPV